MLSLIHIWQSHNRILEEWKQEHAYEISKCLSLLEKQYPQGYLICEKLSYALLANLELGFDDMEKVILMIHLGFYHEHAHQNKYLSIIIAHGYSTASSMAEACLLYTSSLCLLYMCGR